MRFSGPFARLVVVSALSSTYTFAVSGGVINGLELADYVIGYAAPYFAMLWASQDARQARYWPAFHYGLWLWMLWPISLPHYVLRTRGLAGVPLLVSLLLMTGLPVVASYVGWWLYEYLPDFR